MITRVHGRAAFEELRHADLRVRRGPVSIAHVPAAVDDASDEVRVAFALPRRVGTAVVRNRIRRRIRAVLGSVDPQLLPAGDYLVTARADAASIPFGDLTHQVERALRDLCRRNVR